jgi:hypothetical protein
MVPSFRLCLIAPNYLHWEGPTLESGGNAIRVSCAFNLKVVIA